MKIMKNDKFRMLSNFFGVCVYSLTTSAQGYWGNLSVYAMSYVRNRTASDSGLHTPWIISLAYIGWAITSVLAGYVVDFLGHKWTIVLGGCLLQAGVLSGYFLIQRSLVAFNFTFGILVGFGSGFINCIGLQSIISYNPKFLGVLTSFVPSCIALGAILLNQIITLYINPNNLTPDLSENREDYFTQTEVLNRVPSVFLVIGGFNLCCHVIGIFLLKPNKGKGDVQANKDISKDIELVMLKDETHEKETANEISNGEPALQTSENDQYIMNQLKPKEVLKTKAFYALSFGMGVTDRACIVHWNYYKTYGQTWIHDDHFLATLASTIALAMAIVRLLWGMGTEKYGVKYLIICLSCALSLMFSLWYFAPMAGRWFYLVWTVVIGCFTAGVYIVFPVTTLRLFGSDYFSHNYGMVMSSRIFTNAVAPLLMQFMVTTYGYFYMFFGVGCCNVVGLALVICFLPRI